MSWRHKSVTVRVPATSANLGPGFDVLGLAVNVYNDLTLCVDPEGLNFRGHEIIIEGEGESWLPRDPSNLCVQGIRLAFEEAGVCKVGQREWEGFPHLRLRLSNRIPIGSGLGSSSAAIVAGLLAGLALCGHSMAVSGAERLLNLACTVEGHADNVSACIYGGLQIGVHTGERWFTTGVTVPQGLQCIFFVPDARQSTEGARAVLPATVSRSDAVFNLGRACLFVNAFASGSLEDLPLATQDALHQPPRTVLMPFMKPCIEAALGAGARGAFLSGAGSSVMAITSGRKGDPHAQRPGERRDIAVAQAMAMAARGQNYPGRILITQPTSLGAHILELDGDPSAVVEGRGLLLTLDQDGSTLSPCSSSTFSENGLRESSASKPSVTPSASSPLPTIKPDPLETAQKIIYVSTRGDASAPQVGFREALFAGLAPDGGLYVPSVLPRLPPPEVLQREWSAFSYPQLAAQVLSLFIPRQEISKSDLEALCVTAYETEGVWSKEGIAPLVSLPTPFSQTNNCEERKAEAASSPTTPYVLELFHGPTCAFKDVALQLLGRLFGHFLKRGGPGVPASLTVLGATSGDTGSAAMSGLAGIPGIKCMILLPAGRVARVQELQMTTVLKRGVHAVSVSGEGRGGAEGAPPMHSSFDECQAAVKACFLDAEFSSRHNLSAINSINFARLAAQIVYYVWAWLRWDEKRRILGGGTPSGLPPPPSPTGTPPLTLVVPTGNFGNALAGHYAARMGLPIKLHVATNANDVLHRVLSGGGYKAPSSVTPTLAPSMDISIASNFERYLYLCALEGGVGHAAAAATTREWHRELAECRAVPSLPPSLSAMFSRDFTSSSTTDAAIDSCISSVLERHRYALCPHTACAFEPVGRVESLRLALESGALAVLATAHPAKFAASTPSLSAAGLYRGALWEEAQDIGAGGGPETIVPPLPLCLQGLAGRPSRYLVLKQRKGEALAEAVKSLVDALAEDN